MDEPGSTATACSKSVEEFSAVARDASVEAEDELVEVGLPRPQAYRAPNEIAVDVDATEISLYGHPPERFFHGDCDSYCHPPLYIFCGNRILCGRSGCYRELIDIEGVKLLHRR